MKIAAVIQVLCCIILLAACSDSDSSSGGLAIEDIKDRDIKIERVRGIRDCNEIAELAFNTLTDVIANMILEGNKNQIPTGAISETKISKLSGDKLQETVKLALEQNRIDSGSIRWNISKETYKPTYVIYKSDSPQYEGRCPEPMPYGIDEDEAKIILESISGNSFTDLKLGSGTGTDDSVERELTKTERLALLNKNAKLLFDIAQGVSDSYVNMGNADLIQEEYMLFRSTNYGNPIPKEIINKCRAEIEEPRGDGLIYIRFDSITHKPILAQWTCNNEPHMVGQYPDPIEDIDRETDIIGKKTSRYMTYPKNNSQEQRVVIHKGYPHKADTLYAQKRLILYFRKPFNGSIKDRFVPHFGGTHPYSIISV